jgi:hypothetical protein
VRAALPAACWWLQVIDGTMVKIYAWYDNEVGQLPQAELPVPLAASLLRALRAAGLESSLGRPGLNRGLPLLLSPRVAVGLQLQAGGPGGAGGQQHVIAQRPGWATCCLSPGPGTSRQGFSGS